VSEVRLDVEPRTEFGKGAARRTRRAGKIPAVLYGHGSQPRHLSLPALEFARVVREHGRNAVLTLQLGEGARELALTKVVTTHPIKSYIEHVDLLLVRRGERVNVEVPVVLTGDTAPGTLVAGPRTPPEMDAPPAQTQAVVTDAHNPNWVTYYGTQAGTRLAPRQPTFLAAPQGPDVSLGAWRNVPIGGTGTINAVASAPDGRLFASVARDGLRVYAAGANGAYAWSAIHASSGGLASNRVTALAISTDELWVGTADAGVSVLTLSGVTWRTYNTANSRIPSNTAIHLTTAVSGLHSI